MFNDGDRITFIADYGNTVLRYYYNKFPIHQTFFMAVRKTPVSRVTKKYQATIPQAVREVLGISQGDCIAFEIMQGQVVLKKVQPLDRDYLEAVAGTLSEWASEADEEAYRDL